MKWYSVKEYMPISSCCNVLVVVHYIEVGNFSVLMADYDEGWKEQGTPNYFDDYKDNPLEVIYFCYPDPIPHMVCED